MAEENIVEMLVPEKIGFDVEVNKNGAGDSDTVGCDSNLNSSRRNLDSPKRTQKTIPNYLRASTGSCHDFCKYGRRRAMEEEKTRRPFRKRLQKSLPNNKLDSVQVSISGVEKEKIGKSLLDTNGRSPNSKPSFIESRSPDQKPSLDIKANLPTSKVEKVKVVKQKSSIDTNVHSTAQPSFIKPRLPDRRLSLDSKTNFPALKVEKVTVVKQKPSMDPNNRLPDSKPSVIKPYAPDRKFLDKRTSFPLSKAEKSKGVKQKSSMDTNNRLPDSKPCFIKPQAPDRKSFPMDTNNRLPDSKPCLIKPQAPDRKSFLDKRASFPLSKVEKSKGARQKSSEDTNKHSLDRNLSTESKFCLPKLRTALDANTYRPKQNGTSGDKSLPTEKPSSSDHSEIIKREICLPSPIDVPKKKIVTGRKMSKTEEQKFSFPSIKLKPVKVNSTSSGNSDATHGKTGLNRGLKSTGKTKTMASGRKGFAVSAATFTPRASLSKSTAIKAKKSVSPLKNRNKIQRAETKMTETEEVPERTLHVIKTETENNALELKTETISNNLAPSVPSHASSSNDDNSSYLSHEQDDQETEHSASDSDGCSPDKEENLEIREKQPVEENKNKFVRRNKAITSEVKYRSPVKLKFRSGKVMDLHTDTTTTAPRRLRFRKARLLSADQVKARGDFTRRTFKKAGGENGANNGHSSVTVSLKHQDVLGKRDERGLFNNVIEETASKLVGTRKSKVLALVGAFETVISLQ